MAKSRFYNTNLITLNSFQLKIIATVSMLIDHIGYMIIYNGLLYGYNPELCRAIIHQPEAANLLVWYRVCRVIGRIAFPIFCYQLVEGFFNTRNLSKYIKRLFIFAIISEIPVNLVVGNKIWYPQYQNVLWTLLIGLICLSLCERLKINSVTWFVKIIIFAIGAFLCKILKTDYGTDYVGILLIFVFYFFKYDKLFMYVFAIIICFVSSYKLNYGAAVLAMLFIFLYNQKKGKNLPKYFFYVFYPVHLLILYLIVWIPYYLKSIQ